ncbi:Uncharacterized conserved protein, contains Zn finger domain [Nonomuraea maritima]|uniref:Uncharacterized conserved protein, contains Zn finger domain n=1 Tax=Nonomuraea maritima TaxID=683260 RepID=A0A1G9EU21_9ACTN|nr:SWIM zinc finger family protein [Nonomuraea maritima]SDK79667.1 Uncharacterized conserved protein, contains Zn finger domain [Nonomuraea maritima]
MTPRTNDARGFAAFPPQRAGARFATTWWGRAWITAMEDTSLDQTLLRKGRAYAKTGRLGPITVSPGRIAAVAEHEYDTVVTVEQLGDDAWRRFLDQVAAQAGHIAALLDRDMPHDLVAAAEDAAVPLLPAVGDLMPECSCPDWGHPCVHAAALCYQASWLLDADPFVLLLMRGRGERRLVEELRRHGPWTGAAPADGPDAARAVPAGRAFAAEVPPLPDPPTFDAPFTAPALEPADGVDVAALAVLASSAAARARELALRGRLPELTEHQDHVRLAAEHGAGVLPEACAVEAWRHGGADGLDALETPWNPPARDLARARAHLEAAWEDDVPPALVAWRNRWTFGERQLRYGRDGRWYPFTRRGQEWWPAGPPERDPAALLT